jgi:DNA repair protein RecO (recombination protein O)
VSARQRIDQQPGFVLHSYPYRETSLIVEVFSRDHGRIGLVAKGARRPMSQLRGVLMAFQPLLIDWSGGGEMKTLVRAEWQGGQPLLGGQALLCAYYLNELLMRLLPREDPTPAVPPTARPCGRWRRARGRRSSCAASSWPAAGARLRPAAGLGCRRRAGPARASLRLYNRARRGALDEYGIDDPSVVAGRVLLDMAGDFREPETLAGAKALMRRLIQHYLGGQVLQSRRVFTELFAFPGDPS